MTSRRVHRKPHKVNWMLTRDLRAMAKELGLAPSGWTWFAVAQVRGRCYYEKKWFTIPEWVWERDKKVEGYLRWYVCHEYSHYLAGPRAKHGPMFMEALKSVCPEEYLHHELGYKPRNASTAGIRMKPKPIEPVAVELAKRVRASMASCAREMTDDDRREALELVLADFNQAEV